MLLLDGELRITLDGAPTDLQPGDVAPVPAGSEFRVDSVTSGATAWVTTTRRFEAVLADGTRLAPPWGS